MNFLLSIIMSALFAMNCVDGNIKPAVLTGKILNAPTSRFYVINDDIHDTVQLSSDGSFSYSRCLPRADNYQLLIPKTQIFQAIWLENGKHSSFNVDANNYNSFKVSGDTQQEYDFLIQSMNYLRLDNFALVDNFYKYHSLVTQKIDSLISVAKSIGMSEYQLYAINNIKKREKELLMDYGNILNKRNRLIDSDEYYNSFMRDVDVDDIHNMNDYATLHYYEWKSMCKLKSRERNIPLMMKLASREIKNVQVASKFAVLLMRLYCDGDDITQLHEVYDDAKQLLKNRSNKEVDSLFSKFSTMRYINIPNFEVIALDGNKHKFLEIFNKKVTFIDIWSTWCKPCCEEIPSVAKLVEYYKDNSKVEFISISIDQNQKNWLDFVAKHSPKWRQLLIPYNQRNDFLKQFSIIGIPRFFVFTPDGKIYDLKAPRPSNPNIIGYIDNIISKY